MSDSYQAVYDAVRSRISNGDIGSVIREVAQNAFDISWQKQHLQQEIYVVSEQMQRPSVLMRPRIYVDGNMWCALYGDNIQDGVAGFGTSPAEAMADFDKAWNAPLPPPPSSLRNEAK